MSENEHEIEDAQALDASTIEGESLAEPPTATTAANYELWNWFYQPGMAVPNSRVAAGIVAMKQELVFRGFAQGIVVNLPAWGAAVTNRTKDFQTNEGIQADGVIGRVTARHLFRQRAQQAEATNGIPDNLLCKLKSWESQCDPVCLGISGDEGIAQINPPSHPEITVAQMWDPSFALPWAGASLRGSHIYIGDWDGAVASYNVGGWLAKQWVQAGKPATGGAQIGTLPDGSPLYAWDRCTSYVANVRASQC
jgi:hypothetical protein